MAYYQQDQSSSWPAPGRQASWAQPQPPSRSGTETHALNNKTSLPITTNTGASSTVNREEFNAFAFAQQFEGTLPPLQQ